jgi:hypothetical protein
VSQERHRVVVLYQEPGSEGLHSRPKTSMRIQRSSLYGTCRQTTGGQLRDQCHTLRTGKPARKEQWPITRLNRHVGRSQGPLGSRYAPFGGKVRRRQSRPLPWPTRDGQVKKTPPPEAVECTIEAGQNSKTEILAGNLIIRRLRTSEPGPFAVSRFFSKWESS